MKAKRTSCGPRTMESWMLMNGNKGDVFYSYQTDASLTAKAAYYDRDILTERMIVVSLDPTPVAKRILRVTIL